MYTCGKCGATLSGPNVGRCPACGVLLSGVIDAAEVERRRREAAKRMKKAYRPKRKKSGSFGDTLASVAALVGIAALVLVPAVALWFVAPRIASPGASPPAAIAGLLLGGLIVATVAGNFIDSVSVDVGRMLGSGTRQDRHNEDLKRTRDRSTRLTRLAAGIVLMSILGLAAWWALPDAAKTIGASVAVVLGFSAALVFTAWRDRRQAARDKASQEASDIWLLETVNDPSKLTELDPAVQQAVRDLAKERFGTDFS